MKINDRMAWVRLVCVGLLAIGFSGCENEDTDESISSTRFELDRELLNYTDTDDYAWETTLDQALVTVRIKDFIEGDTTLRIFDSRGAEILSAFLNSADSAFFDGPDLFFQRPTDSAEPGRWTVVLGYNDFTGDYEIVLE